MRLVWISTFVFVSISFRQIYIYNLYTQDTLVLKLLEVKIHPLIMTSSLKILFGHVINDYILFPKWLHQMQSFLLLIYECYKLFPENILGHHKPLESHHHNLLFLLDTLTLVYNGQLLCSTHSLRTPNTRLSIKNDPMTIIGMKNIQL